MASCSHSKKCQLLKSIAAGLGFLLLVAFPVFRMTAAQEETIIFNADGEVRELAWSPDGEALAFVLYDQCCGYNSSLLPIWEISTGELRTIEPRLENPVRRITWSSNKDLITTLHFSQVHLSQPEDGTLINKIEQEDIAHENGESSLFGDLSFHPHEDVLAVTINNFVHVWDFAEGEVTSIQVWDIISSVYEEEDFPAWFMAYGDVTWNPQGNLLAVSRSGSEILLLHYPSLEPALVILSELRFLGPGWIGTEAEEITHHLDWSPDGARLVDFYSRSEYSISNLYVWDVESGYLLKKISLEDGDTIQGLDWNHEQNILAVAVDNKILLFDMQTYQYIETLEGHSDLVSSLAWSPDGQQLATGSLDKTIRIWDIPAGETE
jgi:WD40 repeat protein